MKQVKKYKISRRLQAPVFEKCQTQKFALREQSRAPKKRRGQMSDYGKQLIEKQKVRYIYGINERILKNYVKKAVSSKEDSISYLSKELEGRLDNFVFQLGIAPTRRMARQMVSHGHFTINGRKITVPSYQVRASDEIGIRAGSQNTKLFKDIFADTKMKPRVSWASWDEKKQVGQLSDTPTISDSVFSLPLVLEFYSR